MEQIAQFYLIYPLGLVELGLSELKEKWNEHFKEVPLSVLSVDEGGVLIEVPIKQGFLLNHLLRSPTRLLLRIAEFKARDFPKLYQKVSKLPWKSYMIGQAPEVVATATNSRLFDSRKIEKAVQDGILESYRKQPVKKKYLDHLEKNKDALLPKVYYRAVDDVITLSLDTTGEILHKRGDKIYTGLAPIRENLAALLLRATIKDLEKSGLTLIDPMAGSGTFLIEGHDENAVNKERSFAYEHTPLWIDESQKKKIIDALSSRPTSFLKLKGYEQNPDVLKMARKNAEGKEIEFIQSDLFSEENPLAGNNIVVINPPYGLRVGEKEEINIHYYQKIITAIKKKYTPKRLGIIIPEEYKFSPKKEELFLRLPFKNGGLSVVFYVLIF